MSDGTLVPARLLVFRVAALACAAEVDQVREILPRLPTTRIPGAPPVVAGLVNVRGTLVTVVDGWRALGQDPPSTTSGEAGGSTIVLEVGPSRDAEAAPGAGRPGRKLIGFTVDEVLDMLSAADAALEDRRNLPGVDPTLVRAVGRRRAAGVGEELFILLNVAALLGPVLTT